MFLMNKLVALLQVQLMIKEYNQSIQQKHMYMELAEICKICNMLKKKIKQYNKILQKITQFEMILQKGT